MTDYFASTQWVAEGDELNGVRVTLCEQPSTEQDLVRLVRRFAAVTPGAYKYSDQRSSCGSDESFRLYYRQTPPDTHVNKVNLAAAKLPPDPVTLVERHPSTPFVVQVGLVYPASFLDLQLLESLPEFQAAMVSEAPVYAGAVVELFVPNHKIQYPQLNAIIRNCLAL